MMFLRRIGLSALVLTASASFFGCEDDLPKATLIDHMRVLGARTEVVGDEARSTPRPGEKARLTWAMAYPDLDEDDGELSSLFLACTAPSRYTGNPVCQELVDAATGRGRPIGGLFRQTPDGCDVRPNSVQTVAGIRLYCVTGTPELELTIDSSIKTDRLIQGIICRNGLPAIDPESPVGATCWPNAGVDEDDVESIPVYGTVAVAAEEDDENQNPNLDMLDLTLRKGSLSGQRNTWNPTPADQLPGLIEDCSTVATDVVLSSEGHSEVIEFDYPRQRSEDEDLVFSTYATFGELSRRFTVLESDSARDTDEPDLTWELSEEERADLFDTPKLVRFYFTVLDGRGGFDVTTRELCIRRLDDSSR